MALIVTALRTGLLRRYASRNDVFVSVFANPKGAAIPCGDWPLGLSDSRAHLKERPTAERADFLVAAISSLYIVDY